MLCQLRYAQHIFGSSTCLFTSLVGTVAEKFVLFFSLQTPARWRLLSRVGRDACWRQVGADDQFRRWLGWLESNQHGRGVKVHRLNHLATPQCYMLAIPTRIELVSLT